jgi:hypothetical protein
MRPLASFFAAGSLSVATACISPSVLDSSGRAVATPRAEIAWRPAAPEDLRGLFESVSIEGEAAAALWKVEYVFDADGSYSGAALVLGGVHPEFQTLAGSWSLEGGLLDLGDGQTARAAAAGELLKLESDGGVVVLRREAVQ